MTESEKKVIEIIRNWQLRKERIEILKRKIESHSYKVTTEISLAPGRAKGLNISQVEQFSINMINYKKRLEMLILETKLYELIFNQADLSKTERDLIKSMVLGMNPINFARINNIIPNYKIYKIQNSAVKKLLEEYKRSKNIILEDFKVKN
jgi:hypothetical protein